MTPHMIQSLRHWRINIAIIPDVFPPKYSVLSFINFITILNFTIFNIQMNKKFYQ
jgi:hypothetical protein